MQTKKLGKKDELDRWYTSQKTVNKCIHLIDLSQYDCIIEPSAGNGSFIKELNHPNILAFDIFPNGENIKKENWLELDKSNFSKNSLVIGNPPFGEYCSLAIQFFNESAKFAKTIAMIFPATFKKPSIQKKLNKNFELRKELNLYSCDFTLYDDSTHTVDCVFQIWDRNDNLKLKTKQSKIDNITFLKFSTKEDCDFVIRRVGSKAGTASLNKNVSKSSNYFIKNLSNIDTKTIIDKINDIHFIEAEWTVGPNSLSKKELTKYLLELERNFNIS